MYLNNVSIRNFKGIKQNDYDLKEGVNILFGPNEAGKSTFLQALHAVFFINADSSSKDVKTFRSWGSEADPYVSVEFTADGKRYFLEKTFIGKKKARLLCEETGLDEESKTRINKILRELIPLFTDDGQSVKNTFWVAQRSLERTMEDLGNDNDIRNALYDVLMSTDGDINKIRKDLDKQNRDIKRGLSGTAKNPGELKKAIDRCESLEQKLEEMESRFGQLSEKMERRKHLEKSVKEMEKKQQELSKTLEAVEKYRKLKDQYEEIGKQFDTVNEDIENFEKNQKRQEEITQEFKALEKQLQVYERQISDLKSAKETEEIGKRLKQEEELLANVTELMEKISAIEKSVGEKPQITNTDYKRIQELSGEIKNTEGRLQSAQLTITARALKNVEIDFDLDGGNTEQAALKIGEEKTVRANSKAGMKIEERLGLEVSSGVKNADEIQQELDKKKEEYNNLLAKLKIKDINELNSRYEKQQNIVNEKSKLDASLDTYLKDREHEDIEKNVGKLKSRLSELQQNNSVSDGDIEQRISDIEKERSAALSRKYMLEAEIDQNKKNIENFTKKYGSHEKAKDKKKELSREYAKIDVSLEDTPKMELTDKEKFELDNELERITNDLPRDRDELNQLIGELRSADVSSDLINITRAELEEAMVEKEKWETERDAYEVLLETIEEAEAEVSKNITKPVEEITREILPKLTLDRYTGIEMNEGMGVQRVHGTISNETTILPDDLSTGAIGQIALSLRLALIKHLSGHERQTIVIDDALVNFDGERFEEAKKLISDFANDHQVIYMTCHGRMKDWPGGNLIEL